MAGTSFDELDEDSKASPQANRAPIWSLDLEDKSKTGDVLKWLNSEVDFLKEENKPRFAQIERNIALWRGVQYWSQSKPSRNNSEEEPDTGKKKSSPVQKIVLNHLFDLTMQKASRVIEFKPAISIIPQSDDWDDKVSSKNVEKFAEHIQYVNKFDTEVVPPMAIWSRIMGEMYTFNLWDAESGKEHPLQTEARSKNEKIPILGDDDKPTGEFHEDAVPMGEVSLEIEDPFNVLIQRRVNKVWKDVEYCFRRKVYTAEEAKLRFPDFKESFSKGTALQIFDFDTMEIKTIENAVVVWFFYHKHTIGLKKGREIAFHKSKVLDSRPLRYNHGKLPCTRLRDVCGPMELHGRSFYDNVKGGVGAYNNVTNLLLRNALLVAHPKWMLPAGSAKIEQLGNAATVVQYRGPREPKLVTAQAASPELFTLRKELKQDFEQISQVFGVSRGAPPAGVDAAIAMQFLEEQENKASAPDQIEYNAWLENTFEQAISVAGQFYDESDKRTMMILGRNNRWTMKYVKKADLAKDYQVRVKSASALPKGRAARMQSLVYLQTNYPDMIPREMVLEMMDLAQNQKFIDTATVAVRAAEEETERILSGEDCQEPQKWEYLVAHWNVHAKQLQETSFTYDTPKDIQEKFKEHILATEMLMFDKAQSNPAFAQQVMALPNFPLLFEIPAPDPMMPDPAMEGGAPPAEGGGMPPAAMGEMTDQGESQAQELGPEPGEPARPKGGSGIPNMKQSPAIRTP